MSACLSVPATAYRDLAERKEVRQSAWEDPGWDECVRRTGQLVPVSSILTTITLTVKFAQQLFVSFDVTKLHCVPMVLICLQLHFAFACFVQFL